ncbi:tyrosine-type recombinase/integrase [Fodinisporobacter ferrooxydans]|uniref:Tyrosine-type recombinase/integrase n=1 Tax=Fodinisporobacter ferrooxydans TaxID=2901836 RepID=A0ABY4CKF5_9BACL|nr:tyrosine-type recombinase/integrase [Alicyclobacillaceae bacterium MYW30-H2]
MKCQDVDLAQGILFIEKSKKGKSRFVPMSHSMAETCRDYAKRMSFSANSNGYFFPSSDGGKYTRHSAKSTIQNIYAKAGISKLPNGRYPRVHDMRHSKATHLLMSGVNLIYIRDFLGHASVLTTERYAKTNPEFMRKAIEESTADNMTGIKKYGMEQKKELTEFLKQYRL